MPSLMRILLLTSSLSFIVHLSTGSALENLRCLICKQIISETQEQIKKVDPNRKIEVGNYRLDAKGNSHQNMIPYALSEMHITDTLESVCKSIDDYVRATRKDTGELVLLKLIINGGMNPEMSEVDVVQDGDLNKSLKYYCDGVIEEYEESIVKMFQNKEDDIETKLCGEEARLCLVKRVEHNDL